MEPRLSNETGIPLSMAVWLGTEEYDNVNEPNYISATTLLKAPRQIVLGLRIPTDQQPIVDVARMAQSRIGTAIHNSIESSWINPELRNMALTRLGYPAHVRDKIRINPTSVEPDTIPVYLEQRIIREIDGYLIGGKFDFLANGVLEDFKTTGVWSYMSGSNDWKYQLQGSLYRWLNPEIITADHMVIQFTFLDWKVYEYQAKKDSGYPPYRVLSHKIRLIPVAEMEVWVRERIQLIKELINTPDPELPLCQPRDLWQDKSIFKYYKNPEKRLKCTKRFDTHAEAVIRWTQDGRVGVIEEVFGSARACLHCPAFNICGQKDDLIAKGLITL